MPLFTLANYRRVFATFLVLFMVICMNNYVSTPRKDSLKPSLLVQILTPTTSETTKTDTAFPALDCPSFLTLMRSNSHPQQVVDPNQGVQHVDKTFALPYPFYWSVHNKEYDRVRWSSFLRGKYYEVLQSQAWIRILEHANRRKQQLATKKDDSLNRKSIVLDVGSNIGYYTLLSARMGYTVHAFEPNNVNLLRLCESVVLNNWHQDTSSHQHNIHDVKEKINDKDTFLVNIHALGLSNKDGTLPFYSGINNSGTGSFQKNGATSQKPSYRLPVTTLDKFALDQGWLDTDDSHGSISINSTFVRASDSNIDKNHISDRAMVSIPILKVDVEGHEAAVILGAKKLLRKRIIENIFVEARLTQDMRSAFQVLQGAGYKLYKYGSWSGPDRVNKYKNDKQLLKQLYKKPSSFLPKNEDYINMWWKLPKAADL